MLISCGCTKIDGTEPDPKAAKKATKEEKRKKKEEKKAKRASLAASEITVDATSDDVSARPPNRALANIGLI